MRTLSTLLLTGLLVAGCATVPPNRQENLCHIFDQYPEWYDYAKAAEEKWGTPAHILMAFVKRESAFREDARPPRDWFLFIPLPRPSSAYGYGQIQDPAWEDYQRANGGWFKSRTDMEDVLDFIGWYNHESHTRLGISKWDPYRLYLAYHEGHTGFRRGVYKGKPKVIRVAKEVDWLAREYGAQLRRCEHRYQCRHWYQFWPFCRTS